METKKIKYTITFLSDWHAGSGLSAGAEADAVVIKDSTNFPYLPGKTIKGLIKDALLDIHSVQNELISETLVNKLMGYEIKEKDKGGSTRPGSLYFSNAVLKKESADEISAEMSHHLYRNIASTMIDEKGLAKKGSLRSLEVCIPLQLEGDIIGLEKDEIATIEKAFKYIRHIGVNRNRGLGRCQFEIKLK